MSAASQRLALLCLGEIGRRTDLSSSSNVDAAINSSLSSDSEDIKAAASLALGESQPVGCIMYMFHGKLAYF